MTWRVREGASCYLGAENSIAWVHPVLQGMSEWVFRFSRCTFNVCTKKEAHSNWLELEGFIPGMELEHTGVENSITRECVVLQDIGEWVFSFSEGAAMWTVEQASRDLKQQS